MNGPPDAAADPGIGPDDEWGAAPTHPEPGGSEPSAPNGDDDARDDDWGPAVDPLAADVELRGAAAAAAVGRSDGQRPAPADDWTAEDPFAGGPAPDASDDWDAAPPLPMALPAARPRAEREPKAKRRRGAQGHRASTRRDDSQHVGDEEHGGDDGAEDARRGRKADRPPPTAEERLQIALKHAYRYLAKRDRTEAEVRMYLEKRETDPASLEAAIAELLDLKYLDDERYVQRYVEDRRRLDGWGPVRITQGLRKMGVEASLIAPAIAAVAEESEDDDVDLATELVQRRFNRRPLDGDKDRQKALRAVVSKGHSLDVAYAAVRAYEERCAEDGDGMDHGAGVR